MSEPLQLIGQEIEGLSRREREVLDRATAGMTDEQIAQSLGLSLSTVSSYWVRIRGKLGFVSRTELVAAVVRMLAERKLALVEAECESLRLRIIDLEAHATHASGKRWDRAALEAVPEPITVVDRLGAVLFVNDPLTALFAYDRSELIGRRMTVLLAPSQRAEQEEALSEWFERGGEALRKVGTDRVIMGCRKDGYEFRIFLDAASRQGPLGFVAVFILRPFLDLVSRRWVSMGAPDVR